MSRQKIAGFIAMTLAVIIWGCCFTIRGSMVKHVSSGGIVFLQALIAFIVMLLYNLLKRHQIRYQKNDMVLMMTAGILGIAAYQLSVNTAMKYVSSTIAAVFCGLVPVLCYIIDVVVYKKKFYIIAGFSIIASLFGVLIMSMNIDLSFGYKGILLLIFADVIWIAYCIVNKKAEPIAGNSVILMYQFLGAVICSFFFTSSEGLKAILFHREYATAIVFLAVFNSMIATYLFLFGLSRLGLTITAVMDNTIPIVTLIINFVVFGEPIYIQQIIGVFMIFVSVVIISKYC